MVKSNIGRNTLKAKNKRKYITNETPYDRDRRLINDRLRKQKRRENETPDVRNARLAKEREKASTSRAYESPNERRNRLLKNRSRAASTKHNTWADFRFKAFNYQKHIDYRFVLVNFKY